MSFTAEYIPYKDTRSFSPLVLDYVAGEPKLQPFYIYPPEPSGISRAIKERRKYPVNRELLVKRLQEQYADIGMSEKTMANIESLISEDTFTITTAHQPNIFTGHLYFIYKILHVIKLAEELNAVESLSHFVPVYYMGSEDADLDELGQVSVNGSVYTWKTSQSGAVGRMKVDNALLELIDQIEGQLAVEPYGEEIVAVFRKAYTLGSSIEQATFEVVNDLFGNHGLIVLLPDHPDLKRQFIPVMRKELIENFSQKSVAETIAHFPPEYKVQTAGRPVNLFYLLDGSRERIENDGNGGFKILNTQLSFSKEEIVLELETYPERFSPNVILRPLYQEMILPGIAFIGGGAELAYWMELKQAFQSVNVHFPVLVLRNSFLIIDKAASGICDKLGLEGCDLFLAENDMIQKVVKNNSKARLDLNKEKEQLRTIYESISDIASITDPTLKRHVMALFSRAESKLLDLEKKMMRAEKKKYDAQQRQIAKLREAIYPKGILQERVDNIMLLYARHGNDIFNVILENSHGLRQEFCVLRDHKKS